MEEGEVHGGRNGIYLYQLLLISGTRATGGEGYASANTLLPWMMDGWHEDKTRLYDMVTDYFPDRDISLHCVYIDVSLTGVDHYGS